MAKKDKQDDMQEKLYNLQAQQLAAQVANWAAQLEFQKERFRLLEMPQFQQGLQLEVDKLAWQKAQDTWERAYQEAAITGTYNGQPTTQWLMDQARLTGSYNGERTLEGKLTDAQIKDMNEKMKLANDQFITATTGMYNGQKTFDREKFEAAQALEGWKFIATLSGPQNAFKQARAIGSMPGGMNQMMGAFAGQYMLPGSSAIGSGGAGYGAGQLADMMSMGGAGYGAPGMPAGATAQGALPGSGGAYQVSGAAGMGGGVAAGMGGGVAAAQGAAAGGAAPMQATGAGLAAMWDPASVGYVPGRTMTPEQQAAAEQQAVNAWNAFAPDNQYASLDPFWYRPTGVPVVTPASTSWMPGYSYSAPGVQAPPDAWNYSDSGTGQVSVYPPGVYSPYQTADISTTTPVNPNLFSNVINNPYQYSGAPTAPQSGGDGGLRPNQINAENYDTSYDYQKQLMWADFEDRGYDKGLAQEGFLKSLPKYGGVSKGSVAF